MRKALKRSEIQYMQFTALELRQAAGRTGTPGSEFIIGNLDLGQVYFHLEAAEQETRDVTRTGQAARQPRPKKSGTLIALAQKDKRLVIIGEPGAGKTTSLLYLASLLTWQYGMLSKNQAIQEAAGDFLGIAHLSDLKIAYIPIYVQLKTVSTALAGGTSLREILLSSLQRVLPAETARELLDAWFAEHRLWLLADGMDEVPGREQVATERALSEYINIDVRLPICLASREQGGRFSQLTGSKAARLGDRDLALYRLNSLQKREDQKNFITRWLVAHNQADTATRAKSLLDWAEETGGVARMLTNPLLLHMLVEIYVDHNYELERLPSNRSAAYDHYFRSVVWSRSKNKLPSGLTYHAVARVLEHLAWSLHNSDDPLHESALKGVLDHLGFTDLGLDTWVTMLVEELRILTSLDYSDSQTAGRHFAFSHLTFQEYFVAQRLAFLWRERPNGPRWVWRKVIAPRLWSMDLWEIVKLLGAELARPTDSLEEGDSARLLRWFWAKEKNGQMGMTAALLGEGVGVSVNLEKEIFARFLSWSQYHPFRHTGVRFLHSLSALLEDENVHTRRVAAKGLWEIRNPRALDALVACLEDEDIDVRRTAAEALGQIGDKRALDGLLARLSDADAGVRMRATLALGLLGGKQAADVLLARLDNPDYMIRHEAAVALGILGDERALVALQEQLLDVDVELRRSAAQALGSIGDKRAIGGLLVRLEDEVAGVRALAAQALGSIGDKRVIGGLLIRLEDEDAGVRGAAADALGSLGDKQATDGLLVRLEDEDAVVRKLAAQALGSIGDKRALVALRSRLAVEIDVFVRVSILDAMARLEDVQALDHFKQFDRRWAKMVGRYGELRLLLARSGSAAAFSQSLPLPELPKPFFEKAGNVIRPIGLWTLRFLAVLFIALAGLISAVALKFLTPDSILMAWPLIAIWNDDRPLMMFVILIFFGATSIWLSDWYRNRSK